MKYVGKFIQITILCKNLAACGFPIIFLPFLHFVNSSYTSTEFLRVGILYSFQITKARVQKIVNLKKFKISIKFGDFPIYSRKNLTNILKFKISNANKCESGSEQLILRNSSFSLVGSFRLKFNAGGGIFGPFAPLYMLT